MLKNISFSTIISWFCTVTLLRLCGLWNSSAILATLKILIDIDIDTIHGVDARVLPASNGQINFGTHPTTHLQIYGGVLFTVVERRLYVDSDEHHLSPTDNHCFRYQHKLNDNKKRPQNRYSQLDLKSMNFEVQLHLMWRHAISHPQPILKAALDCRLVRLKHFHRRVIHLANCTTRQCSHTAWRSMQVTTTTTRLPKIISDQAVLHNRFITITTVARVSRFALVTQTDCPIDGPTLPQCRRCGRPSLCGRLGPGC